MCVLFHLIITSHRINPTTRTCRHSSMTCVIIVYSRSYAEDVTSVTSGASQGPHSFNLVFVCLFVCLFVCVTAGAIPYLSRICDYKGSTGLYITAVHNICGLLYLSRTVPIFVVLCIRLPDVEGDLERNRETRRKLN